MSIEAAKDDGNDYASIDTDAILSKYAEGISTKEYSELNFDEAENYILNYVNNKFSGV